LLRLNIGGADINGFSRASVVRREMGVVLVPIYENTGGPHEKQLKPPNQCHVAIDLQIGDKNDVRRVSDLEIHSQVVGCSIAGIIYLSRYTNTASSHSNPWQ